MIDPRKRRRARKPMGFAALSRKRVRAIAALGGAAVARDRAHMAAIGARGGRNRKDWRKARPAVKP